MIDSIEEAKELLKEAHEYDVLTESNIDDTITELADGNCDVYNYDLWKWAGEDSGKWAEEALDEFGWDGCGKELTKVFMMGQYLANSEKLREAWEELEEELKDEN